MRYKITKVHKVYQYFFIEADSQDEAEREARLSGNPQEEDWELDYIEAELDDEYKEYCQECGGEVLINDDNLCPWCKESL